MEPRAHSSIAKPIRWAALAVGASLLAGEYPRRAEAEQPRFTFAVLADVQYADKEPAGTRAYRRSLAKLEECAAAINTERPAFVVHLGDLIDEAGAGNLDRVLAAFDRIQARKHYVLGNHDFSVPRGEWLRRLGRANTWYDFAHRGWRFVVLDGMDVSLAGRPRESPRYREAEALLSRLRQAGSPNAVAWNGGIGEEQKTWLHRVLQTATRRRERAVVLCHFPVLEASSTPAHLLWNHDEIVRILEQHDAVAAWFNGHDHRGGYARRNGVHYVTFPGMVESGSVNSWTMVRVFGDRLELRGAGAAPSRVLDIQPQTLPRAADSLPARDGQQDHGRDRLDTEPLDNTGVAGSPSRQAIGTQTTGSVGLAPAAAGSCRGTQSLETAPSRPRQAVRGEPTLGAQAGQELPAAQ